MCSHPEEFYIEDPTRTSGILVSYPSYSQQVTLGNVVNVAGTVGAAPLGERVINATTVQVVSSGEALILGPYFMSLKALGGGTLISPPTNTPGVTYKGTGANNLGLLVKVCGMGPAWWSRLDFLYRGLQSGHEYGGGGLSTQRYAAANHGGIGDGDGHKLVR